MWAKASSLSSGGAFVMPGGRRCRPWDRSVSPSTSAGIPSVSTPAKAHLLKTEKSGRFVSFIPVDVTTYTADQIRAIKAAVKELPEADQARIFYVGDHT
jgi:hypothetical protein